MVSGLIPYSANTPGVGSTLAGPPFNFGGTTNTGNPALRVPAGYMSYQFSPNLWLGMGINAPSGSRLVSGSMGGPRLWFWFQQLEVIQCDAEHRLPHHRLA